MTSSMRGVCPICTLDYEVPTEIGTLGCHRKHFLHKECYDFMVDFDDKHNKTSVCPYCRVEIVRSQVTFAKLTKDAPQEPEDKKVSPDATEKGDANSSAMKLNQQEQIPVPFQS